MFNTELCPSEVDRLEDELLAEQDKLKSVSEELEQTFAEMSGFFMVALTVLKKFNLDRLFPFLDSSLAAFDFSKAFSFLFLSLVEMSISAFGFDI